MFYLYQISFMYLQCVLISTGKSQAEKVTEDLKNTLRIKSLEDVLKTREYRNDVRLVKHLIDSGLTEESLSDNKWLKQKAAMCEVQTVLVSPLRKAMQTCLDLYWESHQVNIVIEPRLADRVNSAAAIGDDIDELIKKFKGPVDRTRLDKNRNWFIEFGQPNSEIDESKGVQLECLRLMQKHDEFQSMEAYYKRLQDVKKDLVSHLSTTVNQLAIISNREALEFLSSTGYHQNFQLINKATFGFGQIKKQYVFIDGVEGEFEKKQEEALFGCDCR